MRDQEARGDAPVRAQGDAASISRHWPGVPNLGGGGPSLMACSRLSVAGQVLEDHLVEALLADQVFTEERLDTHMIFLRFFVQLLRGDDLEAESTKTGLGKQLPVFVTDSVLLRKSAQLDEHAATDKGVGITKHVVAQSHRQCRAERSPLLGWSAARERREW